LYKQSVIKRTVLYLLHLSKSCVYIRICHALC